jgi:glycosyltransferase involved in cell wall biosynthesis
MRKSTCITESESTRKDLARFGFAPQRTHVFPVGIEMEPVSDLGDIEKFLEPTLLSLGALRAMKRTVHQIKAFDLAKKDLPGLKLLIAGSGAGRYEKKVMQALARSPHKEDIRYLGRISLEEKYELMRKSHLILVTSVKEGWGLIVTEAASQGTPAVVYDVDGLRDSVRDGFSGCICRVNSPQEMARMIVSSLHDQEDYDSMRENAWELSKAYTLERCYTVFSEILGLLGSGL